MPPLSDRLIATERDIRALKPPRARTEFRIRGHRNLLLRVTPNSKSFTLLFASPTTGRWRKMCLGQHPAMTLEEAKARAASLSVEVRDGIDPLQARLAVPHDTFGQLVEAYLREHRKRHRAVTTDEVERMLQVDVLPLLKGYRADYVRRADVSRVVEQVAERGSYAAADAVLGVVRALFNWAVERGRLEVNPTAGLRRRNGRKPRERTLTDVEIRVLWHALKTHKPMSRGVRDAFCLQLLLGLRIGEALGARKAEIDLAARTWTIPGNRTKNGREHRLPLSDMAFMIVSAAFERAGKSPWLFPSAKVPGEAIRRETGPISMLRLRRRLKLPQLGSHDLRRTLATRLTEMGVEEAVVAKVLNHSPSSVTGRVYIRADRFEEMEAALASWSERLSQLLSLGQ